MWKSLNTYFVSESGYCSVLCWVTLQLHRLRNDNQTFMNKQILIGEMKRIKLQLSDPCFALTAYAIEKILGSMNHSVLRSQSPDISIIEMQSTVRQAYKTISDLSLNTNGAFDELMKNGIKFVTECRKRMNSMRNDPIIVDNIKVSVGLKPITPDSIRSSELKLRVILSELRAQFEMRFLRPFSRNMAYLNEIEFMHPKNIFAYDVEANEIPSMPHISNYTGIHVNEIATSLREFIVDFREFHSTVESSEMISMAHLKDFFADVSKQQTHKIVNRIYRMVILAPVTQVECERNFSYLKMLKTARKINLGSSTLNEKIIIQRNAHLFTSDVIPTLIMNIADSGAKYNKLLRSAAQRAALKKQKK